ncbi:MAG: hypothetical protein ACLRXQ_01285 [Phascolarctobacterium faecium]
MPLSTAVDCAGGFTGAARQAGYSDIIRLHYPPLYDAADSLFCRTAGALRRRALRFPAIFTAAMQAGFEGIRNGITSSLSAVTRRVLYRSW